MRVLERTTYRDPHLRSRTPMVRLVLDRGELASKGLGIGGIYVDSHAKAHDPDTLALDASS